MTQNEIIDMFRRMKQVTEILAEHCDGIVDEINDINERLDEMDGRLLDVECDRLPSFEELMDEIEARLNEAEMGG